jgi:tRNA threonylcarbamoyladenosine biosynthesis protein TsaB
MKILALEFSSEQRSVAVGIKRESGLVDVVGSASESGGRSTRAIVLIESVLKQAGFEREAIDCLTIGIGPGSYTGIRAGIALAQGWQLARDVKVLGISSVETMARTAQSMKIFGEVNIAIDAQRNEFYCARYHVFENSISDLSPLKLAPLAEIEDLVKRGSIVVGPDAGACGGNLLLPDARVLAQIAGERQNFIPAETLEPIYLRETNFVKAPPTRIIET